MAYLRKAERREALLDAAQAVLRRDGFAGVTTRAIAAETGAANGIVHHHFASGEALRAEAFSRVNGADIAALDAALARLEPGEALDAILAELVPRAADDPHWRLWCEAWDQAQTDPRLAAAYASAVEGWRRRLADIIRRAGEAGAVAAPPDPDASAWRLIALADGLAGFVLTRPAMLTPEAAARHMREAARKELGR